MSCCIPLPMTTVILLQRMYAMHVMQVPVSETPHSQSIVEHQPLPTGHGIDNPMVAPSSTAHPDGSVTQPSTSSMLDEPTHPQAELQPMEVTPS